MWMGHGARYESRDCRVVRSSAGVRGVGAGDFEHKGTATSDGLVSVGLRVDLRIVTGGVHEELIGPVDADVV